MHWKLVVRHQKILSWHLASSNSSLQRMHFWSKVERLRNMYHSVKCQHVPHTYTRTHAHSIPFARATHTHTHEYAIVCMYCVYDCFVIVYNSDVYGITEPANKTVEAWHGSCLQDGSTISQLPVISHLRCAGI